MKLFETYKKLKDFQQERFNTQTRPYLLFAFTEEQLIEQMNEKGVKDYSELTYIGLGAYVVTKYLDDFKALNNLAYDELKAHIDNDLTGEGFIYTMFRFELMNHEYSYTEEVDETLDSLGYTWEEVKNDKRLARGLKKACYEILMYEE